MKFIIIGEHFSSYKFTDSVTGFWITVRGNWTVLQIMSGDLG